MCTDRDRNLFSAQRHKFAPVSIPHFGNQYKKGIASLTPQGLASRTHCAVSSVVEHLPDTEGVTGSNPVSRTILSLRGRMLRKDGVFLPNAEFNKLA